MNIDINNVNALRMLAIDMIENAGSGHPGIALGCAPALYTLYSRHLNVIPDDDKHFLRDRFVMSAGHGSSILYATLFAFGYKIKLEDLKNFRKYLSITPGHPEYGLTPGIDTTTGPLGQGVSTAVGMAIAEKLMSSRFNKPDAVLFDNYTYALVGEGCLMEGVSYEALSLAGTLKLNKLIVLYDCNNVTLDGGTKGVFEQDTMAYFRSLGFNTIEVDDGNDVEKISNAITLAKSSQDKPSFIKINTHIGFGSVYQDDHKAHGSVLGSENVEKLREALDVHSKPFELPKDVQRDMVLLRKRFETVRKNFKERIKNYSKRYPNDFKLLQKFMDKTVDLEKLNGLAIDKEMSGRDLGGLVLNEIAKYNENIVTLCADVSSSTRAVIDDGGVVNDDFSKRNLKCGIREFGMGSVSDGIALYGGLIPVESTFLVFSDYLKPSIRLRSQMKQRVVSVFTHDSIAVGQDGATHQPVEHLWNLRAIPNLHVFRPANLTEVIASYTSALSEDCPSVIALSRQKLVNFDSNVKDALMGGYVASREGKGALNGVIIATGSEVGLALDVKRILDISGYNVRVVSMPCTELFERQTDRYKDGVIPKNLRSIFSIEAGATCGWYKYVGKYGKAFGVDGFGLSATPTEIYNRFGLTSEDIAKEIISKIKSNKDKIYSAFIE